MLAAVRRAGSSLLLGGGRKPPAAAGPALGAASPLFPPLTPASPLAAAIASPLLFLNQVRHRRAGNKNGVWWQPLLPALAAEKCPEVQGKGKRRKRYQQRVQQSKWSHAIRIEGTRRNKIYETLKKESEADRIRELYREYGEMLRQKALKKMAETEAATSADASATPAPGDGQPTESR